MHIEVDTEILIQVLSHRGYSIMYQDTASGQDFLTFFQKLNLLSSLCP